MSGTTVHVRPLSKGRAEIAGPANLTLGLVVFCAALLAVVWGELLERIRAERGLAIESAISQTANLAAAFDEHVNRTIRAADIVLLQIKKEYEKQGAALNLAEFLAQLRIAHDPYNTISIADENGVQRAASYPMVKPRNFKDSENFQFHAAHDTQEIYISKSRAGMTSDKWSIFLSRRLNHKDGRFAGDAVLALDANYFAHFYEQVDLGKDSAIALIGRDGYVRVRTSSAGLTAGTDRRQSQLFTRWLPQSERGSYTSARLTEDQPRIVSYRALRDYPLIVVVGMTELHALAKFQLSRRGHLWTGALMTAVVGLFACVAIIQLRRNRRATLSLQASEAKYRVRIDTTHTGYVILDEATRVVDANLNYVKVSGHERLAQIVGRSASEWTAPHDRERAAEELARCLVSAKSTSIEIDYCDGSGAVTPVEINATAIPAEGGKQVLVLCRDVSSRKRSQEMQAQLAAIVENSNDAIIGRALDGKVTSWNASAERLYGYSKDEAIGHALMDLYPAEDVPRLLAIRERVKHQGVSLTYDVVRIAKSGARVNLSISISPIRAADGAIVGFSVIARDITERLQAEARQRLADSVFNSTAEGIMVTDAANTILAVNPAFTEITGYTAEEVVGRNPRLLQSGQMGAEHYAQMWRSLLGDGRWKGEIVDRRKDGEPRCLEYTLGVVRDTGGDITHYHAVLSDITQRKQMEEQLTRLNDELEDRVRERTAELVEANQELKTFSYSISHDLRAPLRTIIAYSNNALESREPRLDPAAARYLSKIKTTSEWMARLMDDLLNLARLSRQPIHRRNVDLSAIAHDVAASLRQVHPQRSVAVTIAPGMNCHADRGLIYIVMQNLIGNAWKYTGGTAVARVEIGCEVRDGDACYFVRDNGAGFNMKYAHKLFGVFQRLHSQDQFAGTGVGLSIVQRIISRHGGRIWADAQVDGGATFFFTLGKERRPVQDSRDAAEADSEA